MKDFGGSYGTHLESDVFGEYTCLSEECIITDLWLCLVTTTPKRSSFAVEEYFYMID